MREDLTLVSVAAQGGAAEEKETVIKIRITSMPYWLMKNKKMENNKKKKKKRKIEKKRKEEE